MFLIAHIIFVLKICKIIAQRDAQRSNFCVDKMIQMMTTDYQGICKATWLEG